MSISGCKRYKILLDCFLVRSRNWNGSVLSSLATNHSETNGWILKVKTNAVCKKKTPVQQLMRNLMNVPTCVARMRSLNSRAHLKQKKVENWRHSAFFFLNYVGSSKFVTRNVKYKFNWKQKVPPYRQSWNSTVVTVYEVHEWGQII